MADMLSQEEIDALLNGGGESSGDEDDGTDLSLLSDEEKDALGEVGNISMGTAATTLFTLLSQKVTITTPKVTETTFRKIAKSFVNPCVTINIQYKVGIEGANVLIIKEDDVKIITDLMMGGDGSNVPDELTDLHLSAIGEAMNQMIGSSSTSLSEMLGTKVDISPPEAIYEDLDNITEDMIGFNPDAPVVMTAFRMTIGDLIDSEIMQVLPIEVAKQLVDSLMGGGQADPEPTPAPAPQQKTSQPQKQQQQQPQQQQPAQQQQQPMQQPMYQQPAPQNRPPVNAQSVQFETFDGSGQYGGIHSDISLIRDVPLEISVELGRTKRKISEILDFTTGSVIELDRLVGESLDILANGKIIAKGEVVVVDENYGVRITEIVVPEYRLG